MKICVLSDHIPPTVQGGASYIAWNMAVEFAKKGNEVVIITTTSKKENIGISTRDGVLVHTLWSNYHPRWQAYVSLWNSPVVREVVKILIELKPDIVHAHNIHTHLSYGSIAVAKKRCAKVVLTCHDVISFNYGKLTEFIDPSDLSVHETYNYRISAWRQFLKYRLRYNPLRNLIIRRTLRRYVDHIVAVSDALKSALEQNGITNVTTIHNGIEASAWKEMPEETHEFEKVHGIGDAAILFAGRLSASKGGKQILDALALILQSVSTIQLVLAGKKDAYMEEMLAYAKKLGIDNNVVCVGWLSGSMLRAAYHAVSLAAVPSICFDSFPTVNLEAMACGKPVVATCFGGSREAVDDGITGYILNPYDVSTMAAKITDLLQDKYKNKQFGEAGYARVVKEFSLARQVAQYEQIFNIKE